MQKRKTGEPHKGWRASARARHCKRHEWETASLRVDRDNQIVNKLCICKNCGARRTDAVIGE